MHHNFSPGIWRHYMQTTLGNTSNMRNMCRCRPRFCLPGCVCAVEAVCMHVYRMHIHPRHGLEVELMTHDRFCGPSLTTSVSSFDCGSTGSSSLQLFCQQLSSRESRCREKAHFSVSPCRSTDSKANNIREPLDRDPSASRGNRQELKSKKRVSPAPQHTSKPEAPR